MGIVAIISDLHVDINGLEGASLQRLRDFLFEQGVTHLHLAGDTANTHQKTLQTVAFFQEKIATTFHWGNHEMIDLTGEAEIEDFSAESFLNFRTIALSQETLLLGVNGWYDYGYSDLQNERETRRLKDLFWYDRQIIRSASDPQISEAINQRLAQTLEQLPRDKRIILATHFVPKKEFIIHHEGEHQRWNQLNAFLGSQSFGNVIDQFPQVTDVVFGHTHRRFASQKIENTWYHCRPLGYYYEWQLTRDFVFEHHLVEKYRPTKLRTILRQNQTAFMQQKERFLLDEFQRSLTLIPY